MNLPDNSIAAWTPGTSRLTTDRLSLLPSPTTFWALSQLQANLKPLPQPTTFWAFSD
ncbi:MAG: hypothetical protein HC769_18685 [Cyanobacteria bacterium CRU_2_1]|nr:hypothetical protein [Cyanobacteria bacterium CRU_2_1]